MKLNRLFEIVYILLNRKTVTSKELASHFEVSKRTILRDVETLSQAGVPIYTTQGYGGGISILDNYVLNKAVISDEDQNQILFALQSLGSTEHIDVANILKKLQTFFDKSDTSWIEVDLSQWGNAKPDKAKFENLKEAILKKHAVTIDYPNIYGEVITRTIYPLKLLFKAKSWYLQSYCLLKENYRTFKINRILSITLLEDTFDNKQFLCPPIEEFEFSASTLVHLVMKFSPCTAYRIYEEFNLKNIVKNDDGSFIVTVDLPNDNWLYSLLLSFGSEVQVLNPQIVKETLYKQLEKMRQFYL